MNGFGLTSGPSLFLFLAGRAGSPGYPQGHWMDLLSFSWLVRRETNSNCKLVVPKVPLSPLSPTSPPLASLSDSSSQAELFTPTLIFLLLGTWYDFASLPHVNTSAATWFATAKKTWVKAPCGIFRPMHWLVGTRLRSTPSSCHSGPRGTYGDEAFVGPSPRVIARSRDPAEHTLDRAHKCGTKPRACKPLRSGALFVTWHNLSYPGWLTSLPLLQRDWFMSQECQPAALWVGKKYLLYVPKLITSFFLPPVRFCLFLLLSFSKPHLFLICFPCWTSTTPYFPRLFLVAPFTLKEIVHILVPRAFLAPSNRRG